MNAYELAEIMTVHDGSRIWEHGLEIANMLRQQADRIAELEKFVNGLNSRKALVDLILDKKPLSDGEIVSIANSCLVGASAWHNPDLDIYEFVRAIEERHGIK
jgi:hypothetical protein